MSKLMLNGAEVGKIILNGVEYGGGSSGGNIVADSVIINSNGNKSYDVSELEAGYYLATFTTNLEKNTNLVEDNENYRTLVFYFNGTDATQQYSFKFTVNSGSYGAFNITFYKTSFLIQLTTWGGWQLNEIKMTLAKIDPLMVKKYT